MEGSKARPAPFYASGYGERRVVHSWMDVAKYMIVLGDATQRGGREGERERGRERGGGLCLCVAILVATEIGKRKKVQT